jgi:transcriptional regulator with XRE-family HTH domain
MGYAGGMHWDLIRRHYAARLATAQRQGVTQQAVATAGQLSGQNAISKLLANHNLGPSVETFVKAVTGLGLDVSAFFAEIEQCGRRHADSPHDPRDPLEHLHAALIGTRFEILEQRLVLTELLDRLDRLDRTLANVAADRGSDGRADSATAASGPPDHPRARGAA